MGQLVSSVCASPPPDRSPTISHVSKLTDGSSDTRKRLEDDEGALQGDIEGNEYQAALDGGRKLPVATADVQARVRQGDEEEQIQRPTERVSNVFSRVKAEIAEWARTMALKWKEADADMKELDGGSRSS